MIKNDDSDKMSSVELISNLLKQATLSKKEKARLQKELEQEGEGGLGTIRLKSNKEFKKYMKACNGNLMSPGGAAARVGVSRARIHQLEAEGRIRVFRYSSNEEPFTEDDFKEALKMLPFWFRPFVSYKPPKKPGDYIYVDMDSLEKYMNSVKKNK